MYRCELVEITAMPAVKYSVTLGYLQAAAEQDPATAGSWEFGRHVLYQEPGEGDRICAEILAALDEPDVVAFTIYFWNRAMSLRAAQAVKRRWPACRVVIGGNDVTNQADAVFAEAPWVDVLVHGEGELRFPAILEALTGSDRLGEVPGISYRSPGGASAEIMHTAAAARVTELETIPSPLLSGVYQPADIAASSMIVYETNRGCPYSCAFCFWGGATNSKVRQFSMDRIRAELDFVVKNCRPGAVLFIADANFGIFARDSEIAQLLVDLCQTYDKRILVMTNWAKNTGERVLEIATLLHSAGLTAAITLSAQSFDQNVLDIAHRSNIKLDRYRTLQAQFLQRGIPTYTDLIWGLPGETVETFQAGIEECLDAGGSPVIYPLVLLNNTEYARERFRADHNLRTRRLPSDLSNLEMTADVVVAHDSMTEAQWRWGIELRLSLSLYYKALLRASLWYVHDQTGARFVDLLTALREHLIAGAARDDEVIDAVLCDYSANIGAPSRVLSERASSIVGPGAIEEEIHYQALLRRYTGGEAGEELIRAAGRALRQAVPGSQRARILDLDDVVELDIAAANGIRARFRSTDAATYFDVPGPIWAMLDRTGQLARDVAGSYAVGACAERVHGALTVPGQAAQYRFTSYALAIWHGSAHPLRDMGVEIQGTHHAPIAV